MTEFNEIVEQLSTTKEPVFVEAAAGCGKTEAVVQAVKYASGKQLVLTHTHAGVAALRSRFRKYNIPESRYRVATIASWLLRYALAYPSMSGFANPNPTRDEWEKIYPAVLALFERPFIINVLQNSYAGIFVDEYQDCTLIQDAVIKKLCAFLPVRVLGDPLQGIFGFRNDPKINWQTNVRVFFRQLPSLVEPYRWSNEGNNEELGKQLKDIRTRLIAGEEINFSNYSEIQWAPWSKQQEVQVLLNFDAVGYITGIHAGQRVATDNGGKEHLDRLTGRQTHGIYQCIEEMDCYDLMETAHHFDTALSNENANHFKWALKDFIQKGVADQADGLQGIISSIDKIRSFGGFDFSRFVQDVVSSVVNTLPVYRKELFTEMDRATREFSTGRFSTFREASYVARNKTRLNGRKLEKRVISRTLLIKGLEFDHAIVLNADQLRTAENFYVAITRGSKSLIILSAKPTIRFTPPSF
jgi:superfamily I DNA/RNA helicase